MSLPKHHLELLSPARDVSIAKEAIRNVDLSLPDEGA